MEVAYLCDHKACEKGCHCDSNTCNHTLDISHARNFERVDEDKWIEMESHMPVKITTPEQFADMMQWISDRLEDPKFRGDKEDIHWQMDNYMVSVLEELGYEEGVKIFRETPKWYD